MNGVRSIFRRKGYLLTALAAAVLLAASSGTAWAQTVTVDSIVLSAPQRVAEGGDATITVTGRATVEPDAPATARSVTVELELAPAEKSAVGGVTAEYDQGGQVDDAAIVSNPDVILTFGANTGTLNRERVATATVVVRTNDDGDAENEVVAVTGTLTNTVIERAVFTIIDDETQDYVLALDPMAHRTVPPTENVAISVDITADPPHYDDGGSLTLYLVNQDGQRAGGYTFPSPAVIGDAAGTEATPIAPSDSVAENTEDIEITQDHGANGDGNRVTDTITLQAYSGAAGSGNLEASLDINVLDVDGLPAASVITAVAKDEDGNVVTEVMEGGDPVFLTLTVDRGKTTDLITDDELTVDIRAANGAQVADYDLKESRVKLEEQDSGKQSNDANVEIKLSARPDEDVGMEYLVLNLEVSGDSKKGTETSTGMFSIGIVDATDKKIEPKATEADYQRIMDAMAAGAGDEGLNPNETFTLMTSDLFKVMDGYTASYGVSVEGDSVSVSASSEMITVNAVKAGESVIVVTGTARMSSSSLVPSQTVSDVASLKFPVMVVDKMLVVTLEMPDNVMEGNVVEGMSYDIGVMANRMITEAEGSVEVMIMRDRSGSDAGEDDYSVSMATIMAGYDSATAELMVTEDDMPDSGTNDNMGEMLVLYGMVDGEETNALTFTIWDQAVPALPLFGQLLLALFLMLGGARLYRRRQG